MARKRKPTPRQVELQAKRDQLKHSRRLVMQKNNRLKRELGVDTLGKFAPRIPALSNIDRMTEKQLDTQLQRDQAFRQRNVQYVALGRDKEIIPQSRWNQTQRLMRQRQQQAKAAFASIEDIMIDSKGQTIGQRAASIASPRRRQMENNTGNLADPKTPQQVANSQALADLERKLEGMNTGGEHAYIRDKAMESLEQMDQIYTAAGDPGLMDQIRALTDDQFYALWNIRDFANAAASYYYILKQLDDQVMSADKAEMWGDLASQDRDEMQGLIDSVKKIQGTGRRF